MEAHEDKSGKNSASQLKTKLVSDDDQNLYNSFRENVALRKIQVENETGPSDEKRYWIAFETGPPNARCPLILLPPLCGRADCFYKQQVALASLGYRTIALEWPPYWNLGDLIDGFRNVMETLRIQQCHLFGASLGGYLAQKITELSGIKVSGHSVYHIRSLVLCNSFARTDIFKRHMHTFFYWALPSPVLKLSILTHLPTTYNDPYQMSAINFMIGQLESLNQTALAARMTLNCVRGFVDTRRMPRNVKVTVMDVS